MKKTFKLFSTTLLLGSILAITIHRLTLSKDLSSFFQNDIPLSFMVIFIHNVKIYFIFFLPFWRYFHYSYSFLVIFFSIGLAFSHLGFLFTLRKLMHLPFELFALSIPVSTSYRKFQPQTFLHHNLLGIALLFIASLIEFYF